jgi:flagellar basal body-associated protein FliL
VKNENSEILFEGGRKRTILFVVLLIITISFVLAATGLAMAWMFSQPEGGK